MEKVVMVPSLQEKLEKPKYKSHLNRIDKLITKLEKMGKNALKILDLQGKYILAEMKVNNPPYRLYIIVDQSKDVFYVVDWEHKKKQKQTIDELKEKLSVAVSFGFERLFGF